MAGSRVKEAFPAATVLNSGPLQEHCTSTSSTPTPVCHSNCLNPKCSYAFKIGKTCTCICETQCGSHVHICTRNSSADVAVWSVRAHLQTIRRTCGVESYVHKHMSSVNLLQNLQCGILREHKLCKYKSTEFSMFHPTRIYSTHLQSGVMPSVIKQNRVLR